MSKGNRDFEGMLAFWVMVLVLVILFFWGLCSSDRVLAHETHLSDMSTQTNVSINPCPEVSGYIIQSDQRECYLVYKQIDLQHSAMHVQDINLTKDGDCSCPKGDS